MNQKFTAYIRSLGPDGEPPAPESFTAFLRTLRGALIHEMKRRSVWHMPPSFLGVYGGSRWTDGDLLEELLLHCYQFIFLERLAALRRRLQVRSNLDGLVFLNIRHFLYEAQRRHDPLGMRLFEMTHAAVDRLHREGTLHVLDGDPRLRNSTVLGFAAWLDPQLAEGIDLRPQVAGWCDALLPDLVTAWGKENVVAELAAHIAHLPQAGVEVFAFRHLLQPLKSEVRARWWSPSGAADVVRAKVGGGGEDGAWVPLVRPDAGFEQRQSYAELLHCMSEQLGGGGERAKTKEYLRRLWLALRQWAAETGSEEDDSFVHAERVPDNKKLSEALGIPRARIPKLKETLGTLLTRCRDALGSPPPVATSKHVAATREGLRQATGQVAARAVPVESGDRGPRCGDMFLLSAAGLPVEWLLVEHDGVRQLWWTAAVDDAPFLGRHDAVAVRDDGADVRVRCGLGTWMDAALFIPEQRTGALTGEGFENVLARRLKPSASLETADGEPEYRAWVESIQAAADTVTASAATPAATSEKGRVVRLEDWRRAAPRAAGLLAAGFVAVALAFGLWSWSLERALAGALEPVLLPRNRTETVRLGETRRTLAGLRVSIDARYVGFRLPLTQVRAYSAYRLQVLDGEHRGVLWESPWTVEEDELFLLLPRQLFKAEKYVLRLDGRTLDGREVFVDEGEVQISNQE